MWTIISLSILFFRRFFFWGADCSNPIWNGILHAFIYWYKRGHPKWSVMCLDLNICFSSRKIILLVFTWIHHQVSVILSIKLITFLKNKDIFLCASLICFSLQFKLDMTVVFIHPNIFPILNNHIRSQWFVYFWAIFN